MNYTEIVPRENFDGYENRDFVDVKQEPADSADDVQIKVCDWHTDVLLSSLLSV